MERTGERTHGNVAKKLVKWIGIALTVGLLAGAGAMGYLGLNVARSIFDLLGENRRLHAALTRLTAQRQVGYAKVLDQTTRDGALTTRLLFVVTDPEDQTRRVLERQYEIEGDVVHFDALIVKFSPDLVMDGKARAMHLWHRVYGEKMTPEEAYAIETPGAPGSCYGDLLDELDPTDRAMFWEGIWDLANDPRKLASAGVDAVYGSGVYSRLRPGLIYIFNVDANGTFYPQTVPDL
jgi:hypothetical protein